MSKLPYMQFFPTDFMEDAMLMSNEEAGIYIKMICQSHIQEGIPKKRLPFLVQNDWDNVSEFTRDKFLDMGEIIINKRVYKDITAHAEYIEKQRINGSKGGRPKTQKNLSNSNTNSNTNSSSNSKTKTKSIIPSEEEFLNHGFLTLQKLVSNPEDYEFGLKNKYYSWLDENWKTASGKKIKSWKLTLNNHIPHIKPIKNKENKTNGRNENSEHERYRRELISKIQS